MLYHYTPMILDEVNALYVLYVLVWQIVTPKIVRVASLFLMLIANIVSDSREN